MKTMVVGHDDKDVVVQLSSVAHQYFALSPHAYLRPFNRGICRLHRSCVGLQAWTMPRLRMT